MEIKTVKTVYDDLNKYDYLAKDNDFISITKWSNGDGFDISMNDTIHFSLSYGQLEAINYLTKALDVEK